MTWLLETALGNTLLVSAMALAVLAVSRVWRRAALLHAVWVLVLIKFVTPGFVAVAVPGPWSQWIENARQVAATDDGAEKPADGDASASRATSESPVALRAAFEAQRRMELEASDAAPAPTSEILLTDEGEILLPEPEQKPQESSGGYRSWLVGYSEGDVEVGVEPASGAAKPGAARTLNAPPDSDAAPDAATVALAEWLTAAGRFISAWFSTLLAVSFTGTAFCLLLAGVRVMRFQAAMRHAHRAPRDLQRRVDELSAKIGLGSAPITLVVPGRVSPMVWFPLGAPKLLFPKGLLERLEGEALDSLLLHELAHVRRRDHWVRWLELLVTALFWWNPVVWIARREIHECEEECCDALVLANLPGRGRTYASAIIETIEFLAGDRRITATPLACGVGRMAALERRLTQIMRPTVSVRLTATARVALCLTAIALLPLLPTLAQNGERSTAAKPAETAAEEQRESNEAKPTPTDVRPAAETAAASPRSPIDPTEFEAQPRSLAAEPGEIFSIDFSRDGAHFAVASGRWDTPGSVTLWGAATRRVVRTWQTPKGIASVQFSPDDRRLAAVGWDRNLRIFDVERGEQTLEFFVGEPTARLAYSPDGKLIATATEGLESSGVRRGNEVKLWNAETGKEMANLSGDMIRFQDVAFSSDGALLAACGGEMNAGDGQVNVWEVASRRQVRVLKGHTRTVFGVSFSPDGTTLASSSLDGSTKVWNAASGELLHTLVGPPSGAYRPEFSPDGKLLAVAGFDGAIKLWDVAEGRELGSELRGHSGQVRVAVFSPDGKTIVSGGSDRSVRFWDVESRQQVDTAYVGEEGAQQIVLAVAHSPDARRIAVAGEDQTVRILQVEDGQLVQRLEGFDGTVTSLAFSPDGRSLATACYDTTVRLWNVADGTEIRRYDGHTSIVTALDFSGDGKQLATAGYDKTIRVWDAAEGKQLALLEGHTVAVKSLAFSPSGEVLVSGSADRTVKVWSLADHKELQTLKGHEGAIRAVAVSPDGKVIASAAEDKQVRIWELASGKLVHTLDGHEDMVWSLVFSPGGKSLASGDARGQIKIWNPENGALRATLSGHQDAVSALSFAPDGSHLASGSYDKTLRIWDAKLPPTPPLLTLEQEDNVLSVGLSPDGKFIAVGGAAGRLTLYDLKTGKETHKLAGHKSGVHRMRFSPDSRLLATGSYDRTIHLWDVARGELHAVLTQHKSEVRAVEFSSDNRRLATADWDGNVIVWEVETRSVVYRLPKQSLPITSCAFTPDGKLLATASGSWKEWKTPGELKLWDGESGAYIGALDGFQLEIKWVRISPDGRLLTACGAGQRIKTWDLSSRTLLREIEHTAAIPSGGYLPQGDLVATGDMQGGVIVWNAVTGSMVSRFEGHTGMVSSLDVSGDGSLLATTGADKTVKLWRLAGSQEEYKVNLGAYLFNVDISADGTRVAASGASRLVLLDGSNGNVLQRFAAPAGKLAGLDLSPDGKLVLTGGADGVVRLWDAASGNERLAMRGHQQEVRAVALSPDGSRAASAGFDNNIIVWDLSTGRQRTTLSGHTSPVWSLAFSPGGEYLASGSSDQTARVWSLENGEQLCVCDAGSMVGSISFTPDGEQLVTGQGRSGQCLWNAKTGELVRRYYGNVGNKVVTALAPDGGRIYSSSDDGVVLVWDAARGVPLQKLGEHGAKVTSIAASADRIATVGEDHKLRVWRVVSQGRESTAQFVADWSARDDVLVPVVLGPARTLLKDSSRLWFVAVSPDGLHVAAGGDGGDTSLLDLSEKSSEQMPELIAGKARCGAFSHDGKWLAIGDKGVTIWDVETRKQIASFASDSLLRSVAFSSDGKLLAIATEEGIASLWSTADWTEVRRIQSATLPCLAAHFSPDAKLLVTSTARITPRALGEIQLWDVATGNPVTRVADGVLTQPVFSPDGQWIAFRNPSEMVMTWKTAVKRDGIRMQSTHGAGPIAFSPDGRLLATGFGEGMVRLSDAETGRLVAELKGHTDRVRSLAFTPDGSQLLSAAFDGAVLMWNVGPDQLAAKGDTPETASDP